VKLLHGNKEMRCAQDIQRPGTGACLVTRYWPGVVSGLEQRSHFVSWSPVHNVVAE
jgi:hypothetical protein